MDNKEYQEMYLSHKINLLSIDIETLHKSSQTAKDIINQQIDSIIEAANQRRKILLNEIESVTLHKNQILSKQQKAFIQNRKKLVDNLLNNDAPNIIIPTQVFENESNTKTVSVDININDTNDIITVLKTLGSINNESDYVAHITQDFEYESLLCSGYIRSNTMDIMNIPKEIHSECLKCFSLYLHLKEDEKKKYIEEKNTFNKLKEKIKTIIGDSVVDVVISDLNQRENSKDMPCVIIDHSKKENVLKKRERKRSIAIDPSNVIICVMKQRFVCDPNDKTITDLVWLLYEVTALTSGFMIKDPQKFAQRVYKLVKLGLAIFDDDESDDEDDEDDAYEEYLYEELQSTLYI